MFTFGGCRTVNVTIPKGMKFSAFGLAGSGFSCKTDMPAETGCYAKGGTRDLEACSGRHDKQCDSWRYQNADDFVCNYDEQPMSGVFSACAYYFAACDDGDCRTDRECDYHPSPEPTASPDASPSPSASPTPEAFPARGRWRRAKA